MATLVITRGLPGSGKSTWASGWVEKDPQRRARVNRDDIRGMAHFGAFVERSGDGPGTEWAVRAARDAMILALLRAGVDVICDDTNLPDGTVAGLRRLAVLAGAYFQVVDLTNVPLDECLRRNAQRTGRDRVPEDKLRDMYLKYVKGKPYPLPLPEVQDTTQIEPLPERARLAREAADAGLIVTALVPSVCRCGPGEATVYNVELWTPCGGLWAESTHESAEVIRRLIREYRDRQGCSN